ncbi:unnamed protein product [Phytophthora fragariaefolia]|uniref:Unnamed protein product n=1 Tax=Phytophthora fragariaefolia TaxID=1490495 RepID=A0A9W6Y3Q7_9STRA|nr:unnamed protein product [Phytophthora fragariaefolia]
MLHQPEDWARRLAVFPKDALYVGIEDGGTDEMLAELLSVVRVAQSQLLVGGISYSSRNISSLVPEEALVEPVDPPGLCPGLGPKELALGGFPRPVCTGSALAGSVAGFGRPQGPWSFGNCLVDSCYRLSPGRSLRPVLLGRCYPAGCRLRRMRATGFAIAAPPVPGFDVFALNGGGEFLPAPAWFPVAGVVTSRMPRKDWSSSNVVGDVGAIGGIAIGAPAELDMQRVAPEIGGGGGLAVPELWLVSLLGLSRVFILLLGVLLGRRGPADLSALGLGALPLGQSPTRQGLPLLLAWWRCRSLPVDPLPPERAPHTGSPFALHWR